jgi:C4-dicarboxylate-specific signal transduction histidine kinase
MEAMGENGRAARAVCGGVGNGVHVVHIIFRDSGPGLSEDAARRLFEPYFSTKTTGTGLGLAICRIASREMGGDDSQERRGRARHGGDADAAEGPSAGRD